MSSETASLATGSCDECGRPCPLRWEDTYPPMKHLGIREPFKIRFYLCRWHLAASNRQRKQRGLPPHPKGHP